MYCEAMELNESESVECNLFVRISNNTDRKARKHVAKENAVTVITLDSRVSELMFR